LTMNIAEPDTLVGWKSCGCLGIAIVDTLEHRRDTAREIGKAIREGYRIERLPTATVRTMEWKCTAHTKAPKRTLEAQA